MPGIWPGKTGLYAEPLRRHMLLILPGVRTSINGPGGGLTGFGETDTLNTVSRALPASPLTLSNVFP